MSEQMFRRNNDRLAAKWLALAERRRDHYVDLYRSGRWRYYYTEQEFHEIIQDVIADVQRWASIAPEPQAGAGAARRPDFPAALTVRAS